MAETLLHIQEAEQAVHNATVQSTDTWKNREYIIKLHKSSYVLLT
jgi:hypothetical protein